jgi:hypothetical protein
MSEERRKVLEMLAEGKITAEEADRLLSRLSAPEDGKDSPTGKTAAGSKNKCAVKFLRVCVDDGPKEQVNIRIPIGLIRAGLKLTSVIPKGVQSQLCDEGFDLSAFAGMAGDELCEALRDLKVDVDSGEGEKVRVFCE